jgi:hypothetical protein
MRLSGLAVAVVLLFSSAVFAQHSSSGGSSSGGSSSGGTSAASFSSGGHSSGSSGSSSGHSSAGSSSHGTSAGSSKSPSNARSTPYSSESSVHLGAAAQPEKRTFVSHLFHPFRKPEAKLAQADLRRSLCSKGHCVCPGGQAVGKGGACSAPIAYHQCRSDAYWSGGGCTAFTEFHVNDCSALALLMDQQAQRMGMAENMRQASCSRDPGTQECGDLSARSASEAGRYKTLRQQYEQCRRRQSAGGHYGYSFAGNTTAGLRDPFAIE